MYSIKEAIHVDKRSGCPPLEGEQCQLIPIEQLKNCHHGVKTMCLGIEKHATYEIHTHSTEGSELDSVKEHSQMHIERCRAYLQAHVKADPSLLPLDVQLAPEHQHLRTRASNTASLCSYGVEIE